MSLLRRQMMAVTMCFVAVVCMLIWPPWYWNCPGSTNVTFRQLMAGYDWIWSPPPAPQDLPDCYPAIRWGLLVTQCLFACTCTLLIMLWMYAREPFQWLLRLDRKLRSPSD